MTEWLSRKAGGASFETTAARSPQDDDVFVVIKESRHPEERPAGPRLEGRTEYSIRAYPDNIPQTDRA